MFKINFKNMGVQALLATLLIMTVITGASAHSLNQSTWSTQSELESISPDNSVVTSGGQVQITEGTTYSTANISASEPVSAITVNISSNPIDSGSVEVDVYHPDGSRIYGTMASTGGTGDVTVDMEEYDGTTPSDFYVEITVPDDGDGTTGEIVEVTSVDATIVNQYPVLVFDNTDDVRQTTVGDNLTIDISQSFDGNGDNLTYEYDANNSYSNPDWQTIDDGTLTVNKSSAGEYDYRVRVVDEHGASTEGTRTVQVLESTETTGGSGTTGDSGGPLGFGIPVIVYGLVAGIIILLSVASIDE
jgi:hypothetical protein